MNQKNLQLILNFGSESLTMRFPTGSSNNVSSHSHQIKFQFYISIMFQMNIQSYALDPFENEYYILLHI
jgi:hypothetical protein